VAITYVLSVKKLKKSSTSRPLLITHPYSSLFHLYSSLLLLSSLSTLSHFTPLINMESSTCTPSRFSSAHCHQEEDRYPGPLTGTEVSSSSSSFNPYLFPIGETELLVGVGKKPATWLLFHFRGSGTIFFDVRVLWPYETEVVVDQYPKDKDLLSVIQKVGLEHIASDASVVFRIMSDLSSRFRAKELGGKRIWVDSLGCGVVGNHRLGPQRGWRIESCWASEDGLVQDTRVGYQHKLVERLLNNEDSGYSPFLLCIWCCKPDCFGKCEMAAPFLRAPKGSRVVVDCGGKLLKPTTACWKIAGLNEVFCDVTVRLPASSSNAYTPAPKFIKGLLDPQDYDVRNKNGDEAFKVLSATLLRSKVTYLVVDPNPVIVDFDASISSSPSPILTDPVETVADSPEEPTRKKIKEESKRVEEKEESETVQEKEESKRVRLDSIRFLLKNLCTALEREEQELQVSVSEEIADMAAYNL
jgi:hypothetical protein